MSTVAKRIEPLLSIKGLAAMAGDLEILKGIDLDIYKGEVHAIMGPNGSGKSTLANILAGHPSYTVNSGEILFKEQDMVNMLPEDRARAGLFLCFQHPTEVPGVRLDHFVRAGYNSIKRANSMEEMDVLKFDRLLNEKVGIVEMDRNITKR